MVFFIIYTEHFHVELNFDVERLKLYFLTPIIPVLFKSLKNLLLFFQCILLLSDPEHILFTIPQETVD